MTAASRFVACSSLPGMACAYQLSVMLASAWPQSARETDCGRCLEEDSRFLLAFGTAREAGNGSDYYFSCDSLQAVMP